MNANVYTLLLLVFASACYQPEEQYTSIKRPTLAIEGAEDIVADSFSVYKVIATLPGLRFQDSLSVKMVTTWGYWPNNAKEIQLNSPYSEDGDFYQVITYLKSERTVTPFSIELTSNPGTYSSYQFMPQFNYPDTIFIVPDSLSLKLKPGSYTHATAYLYSEIGYPSYGLRFAFDANNESIVVPLQEDFDTGESIKAKVLLSNETQLGKLKITGSVKNAAKQPLIKTVEIVIHE